VINVSNRADIDVGFVPLEDSGVASCTIDKVLASPGVQGALDGIRGLRAQGA
jgi:hypothetical protein